MVSAPGELPDPLRTLLYTLATIDGQFCVMHVCMSDFGNSVDTRNTPTIPINAFDLMTFRLNLINLEGPFL